MKKNEKKKALTMKKKYRKLGILRPKKLNR